MNAQLLILDLDETLIHTVDQPLSRRADFEFDELWVYIRPHLAEFLEFCAQHFQVAVWTSSTEAYADVIVKRLFGTSYPLAFVWLEACTRF